MMLTSWGRAFGLSLLLTAATALLAQQQPAVTLPGSGGTPSGAQTWIGAELGGAPEKTMRLPVDGLVALEINGRIVLASTNFHYLIIPERIVDGWNQLEVRNWADVVESTRIPIDDILGDRIKQMGTVVITDLPAPPAEERPPEVVIWLDAYGRETPALIAQLQPLLGAYRFRFLWLPHAPLTADQNAAFICAPQLAETYIRQGQLDGEVLKSALCDTDRTAINMVTAQILGIQKVPTIFAENGEMHVGLPPDLSQFLSQNASE